MPPASRHARPAGDRIRPRPSRSAPSPTSRSSTTTSARPTPTWRPSGQPGARRVPIWQPILLGGIWQHSGGGSWARTDARAEGRPRSSAARASTGCSRSAGRTRGRRNTLTAMRAATFAQQGGRAVAFRSPRSGRRSPPARDLADDRQRADRRGRLRAAPEGGAQGGSRRTRSRTGWSAPRRRPRPRRRAACRPSRVGDQLFWGDDRLEEAAAGAGRGRVPRMRAPMRFRPPVAGHTCAPSALVACGEEESDSASGQDEGRRDGERRGAPARPHRRGADGATARARRRSAAKPKVDVPKGPPPGKLEIKDLKKGTGAGRKAGDTLAVDYVGVLLLERQGVRQLVRAGSRSSSSSAPAWSSPAGTRASSA